MSTWILAVVVGLLVVIVTNWLKDVIRARLTSDEKSAMNSTKSIYRFIIAAYR